MGRRFGAWVPFALHRSARIAHLVRRGRGSRPGRGRPQNLGREGPREKRNGGTPAPVASDLADQLFFFETVSIIGLKP